MRCASALAAVGLGFVGARAATSEVDIRRDATVAAIERVMPSVVNIATSQLVREYNDVYEILRRRFYGGEPDLKERRYNIGSGVIIDQVDDEVYILTNLHVVNGANRVQVQLMDGRVYEADAKLLGMLLKDLALLRIIRRPGDQRFVPIRFAEDDDLLLGETVITVGNPFGLGGSVSRGILSSKNRRPGPEGNKPLGFEDWLQTDADINPGNSGGPLVNLRGELIGINVAVYNEGEGKGTGFAIPVKQISAALSDFFSLEYYAQLWFGARIKGGTLPLTVREVQPNSPADKAGLRVGQQIAEVNDKPVSSLVEFSKLVSSRADHTATITVLDNGRRRTLKAELVPMLDLDRRLLNSRLGLGTQALTEAQATNLQIKPTEGLLVTQVEKDSPAAQAQVEAGMVLTAVDGVKLADLVNISNVLGNKKSGERVQLSVIFPRRLSSGYVSLQQWIITVPVR
ncbi:MAG TPA: trypsin-like peptidase domain-containing protein [Verrucomicrobiae bacterium]|nr:trypsin-like peptidase domain-containing protein [Verrucomicrobiae bacterium]